jgi:hypothetical protein
MNWVITNNPRAVPKDARHFITKLCLFHNDETKNRLDILLQKLSTPTTTLDPEPSTLVQLAERCLATEVDIAEHSFIHMRSLLTFTLWIEQYVFSFI